MQIGITINNFMKKITSTPELKEKRWSQMLSNTNKY